MLTSEKIQYNTILRYNNLVLEDHSMVKKIALLILFGLAFVVCIVGSFPWYTKILAGLTMLVGFIIVLTTDFKNLK